MDNLKCTTGKAKPEVFMGRGVFMGLGAQHYSMAILGGNNRN